MPIAHRCWTRSAIPTILIGMVGIMDISCEMQLECVDPHPLQASRGHLTRRRVIDLMRRSVACCRCH
jgi:hypothetical protein